MTATTSKTTIIGYVGQDPIIRKAGENEVANFSLAHTEQWTDKETGEITEKTHWFQVVIFNKNLIDICKTYLRKGMLVYVEGNLESRQWLDENRISHNTAEIVLRNFNSTLKLLNRADSPKQEGDSPKDILDENHHDELSLHTDSSS